MRLAESTGDPGLVLEANYGLGAALYYLGEFVSARAHLEQSIALYNSQQQRRFLAGIGMEAGVASRSHGCLGLMVRWAIRIRPLRRIREALTLAREVAHPSSLVYALIFASPLHTWRGEAQAGLELADACIALSREQGFPSWAAVGIFSRGYALAAQGEEEKGIAQMLEGIAGWRAVGAQSAVTGFLAGLLEAYLKSGSDGRGGEGPGRGAGDS